MPRRYRCDPPGRERWVRPSASLRKPGDLRLGLSDRVNSRVGAMELPARVLALLQERGETVATAESLTGGRLAAALNRVHGASNSYVGGVVPSSTSVKQALLGVPVGLVERYGVISAECAL